MKKELLASVFRLKLEALGLVTQMLPEPLKEKKEKCQRQLVEVIHQVTGEYLAEEKNQKTRGTVEKVEIV